MSMCIKDRRADDTDANAQNNVFHNVKMLSNKLDTNQLANNFSRFAGADEKLDEVIERAMRAVPVLHGARVVERWAGLRPRAKSRAPMLGAHPLRPGEYIANGGFKIGFGMAPKVAEVMAALILEGEDGIPEGFRPEASLSMKPA